MFAKRKALLPVVLIFTLACAAYLPTVMPDISRGICHRGPVPRGGACGGGEFI